MIPQQTYTLSPKDRTADKCWYILSDGHLCHCQTSHNGTYLFGFHWTPLCKATSFLFIILTPFRSLSFVFLSNRMVTDCDLTERLQALCLSLVFIVSLHNVYFYENRTPFSYFACKTFSTYSVSSNALIHFGVKGNIVCTHALALHIHTFTYQRGHVNRMGNGAMKNYFYYCHLRSCKYIMFSIQFRFHIHCVHANA